MVLWPYLEAMGSSKAIWKLLFSTSILILKALPSHLHNLFMASLSLAESLISVEQRTQKGEEWPSIWSAEPMCIQVIASSHWILPCARSKTNMAFAFLELIAEANWWTEGFYWSVSGSSWWCLPPEVHIFKGLKAPMYTEIYHSLLEPGGGFFPEVEDKELY